LSYILVIDSDPLVGELLVQTFQLEGHKATLAANGMRAYQYALSKAFDLVLMDLSLPSIGGIELFNKLRALRPNLPVIVLSAAGSADLFKQCKDRGARRAVQKPISADSLVGMTEEVLQPAHYCGVAANDDRRSFTPHLSNTATRSRTDVSSFALELGETARSEQAMCLRRDPQHLPLALGLAPHRRWKSVPAATHNSDIAWHVSR
jgi:CheY-like chemotaxis protein